MSVEAENIEPILGALFDMRRDVSRIVELLEEDRDGEEDDDES
jgi:hypothetical protein